MQFELSVVVVLFPYMQHRAGLLSDNPCKLRDNIKLWSLSQLSRGCFSAKTSNVLWRHRKEKSLNASAFLLFSPSASYRLYIILLCASYPLCSMEKCPTVPPRGTLENYTPIQFSAGVNQFLCSSCWIEMRLSVKHRITYSNSFQHNKDNRSDRGKGGGIHDISFPPTGTCIIPNVSAWNTNTQTLRQRHTHSHKTSICHLFKISLSLLILDFNSVFVIAHTLPPQSPKSPNSTPQKMRKKTPTIRF